MAITEGCGLCAKADPPRVTAKISVPGGASFCPLCDRIACGTCKEPDLTGKATTCAKCGERIRRNA